MLKLELEISELDYAALVDYLLPQVTEQLRNSGNPLGMLLSNGMSPALAKKVISTLPQSQLDGLVADVVNKNSQKMVQRAQDMADQQGIHARIASVRAIAR